MLIICTLLGVIFLMAIILWREVRKKSSPPGPVGLPIVGYLPWIDAKAPYESLTKLARKYGPVCSLKMGSVNTVLVSDPRLVKQILTKDAFSGRAPLYFTHGIMKGYGLICAEGELWKDQRRFVSRCLKNMGMVRFQCAKRDKMEERIMRTVDECISIFYNSGKDGFDPTSTLHHCIGSVMNDLVFGKIFKEDAEVWKWLRDIQEEGVKYIGIAGPLNFLPFLRFLPQYCNIMQMVVNGLNKTHAIYEQWIQEHIKHSDKSNTVLAAFNEEMLKQKSSNDVGYFDVPQFYFLLADLHGAGTDTTLATLRWFLLFMAAFPDEQEKVYKEMESVLENRGPTLEDRSVLPRLEAAIAETQRLRSVVPVGIPHGTVEDTKIGEYFIPKGTMVVPLQWAIHTDPTHWTEPLKYNPDRFIEDDRVKKPEAFLPFQCGKRICVGEELAKMILFLYASHIVHKFSISLPDGELADLEGSCGITLIPKPHRIVFTSRR